MYKQSGQDLYWCKNHAGDSPQPCSLSSQMLPGFPWSLRVRVCSCKGKIPTGGVEHPAGNWACAWMDQQQNWAILDFLIWLWWSRSKSRFLPPVPIVQSQLKGQVGATLALLPTANLLCQAGLQMPTCIFLMWQFLLWESKQRCLGRVKELFSRSIPGARVTHESAYSLALCWFENVNMIARFPPHKPVSLPNTPS